MKKGSLFLVGFFLAVSLVSAADFSIRKNSSYIDGNYLEGDVVSGILNMSFDRQENVYFTNSLNDQKIRLLDVFNAMNLTKGSAYTCDPVSCLSYYAALNGETAKRITLGEEKRTYGFRIKESDRIVSNFDELEFWVDVYVSQTCWNQIYIDLFDDGKIDYYNTKPRAGSLTCGSVFYPITLKNRGCFDEEDSEGDVPIGRELYCEYMKDIPPAASYEIGGKINVLKSGGNLAFAMYPLDGGDAYGGGWLNGLPLSVGTEFPVVINHSALEKFDALVCVYTEERFADYFTINTNEDDRETCGLVFEPGDRVSKDDFELDFDLFIKPRGFESVSYVRFDRNTYETITDRNLRDDVAEYLNYTYGMNCSGEDGCVIPFSIWGMPAEGQLLYGGKLGYRIGSGTRRSQNPAMIYELRERPARVSTGWTMIPVEEMDFKVPNEDGKHTFRLFLGGEEVIEKIIDVDIGFSFEVTPRFAYIGRETIFTARSAVNVTHSIWEFGDGASPITVQGTSVKHTFESDGEYAVKVTLVRGSGLNSTKRFTVIVGEAKTSASLILRDYEARIANLESDISTYPTAVRTILSSALGIETKKSFIQSKKQEFEALSENAPESSYISIIDDLLSIDLPSSVYTSATGTLPAEIGYEKANMAHVMEIAGIDEVPPDEDELKASVFGWMMEHYDVQITFEAISAKNEIQETEILKTYKITLVEKKDPETDSAYLVIGYPKNALTFISGGDRFRETSVSGGTYAEIKMEPITSAEFAIVGASSPGIMNLGVYISPPPSSLGIDTRPIIKCWLENCDPEGNFLWRRFLISLSIILVFFLAVYLLLQWWYKHNYEKHLFPNSNDLYNLLNFIYNSRRNGLKDTAIKETLRGRKWTSEQITYAFRKLEGKRTGMWEIPLFKFAENRKVRKELEKQQGGRPIDTRFIKRPNL